MDWFLYDNGLRHGDWLINGFYITLSNKINKGESNRKLPKMFAGKKLRMTHKKALYADLIKKGLERCVKNKCVRGR